MGWAELKHQTDGGFLGRKGPKGADRSAGVPAWRFVGNLTGDIRPRPGTSGIRLFYARPAASIWGVTRSGEVSDPPKLNQENRLNKLNEDGCVRAKEISRDRTHRAQSWKLMNARLFHGPSERILRFLNQISSPWSWIWMAVLNFVPKPGRLLYLLAAMSCFRAGLSSSYSRIFEPFSQCSTCLP